MIVGRLAPSPTGALHLGNARSFLLAWLHARQAGGRLILRVEDLDGPRRKAGADLRALEDLRWLGLDWDGEALYQQPRMPRYQQVLESLLAQGLVYPCVCTRSDVAAAASAPHLGHEGPVYPGLCRERWSSAAEAEAQSGRRCAWRLRVPAGFDAVWRDGYAGPQSLSVDRELGDFVVWKNDGEAAYQLAVVVDDADQSVNQVVRGDDLLPSTARQMLLYHLLGWPAPEWWHAPLVTGRDGRRLAKRHGDTTLRSFREQGHAAATVLAWIGRHSGVPGVGAECTAAQLLAAYEPPALPRSTVVWSGSLAE